MTSSNSRWTDSAETALRAPRWAPSELQSDPPNPTRAPTPSVEADVAPAVDPAKEAADEAFVRGVEEGRRLEAEAVAPTLAALEAAMEEMHGSQLVWVDNIEKNLMALAVAVARQVVGEHLRADPESIQQLVTRALGRFPLEVPLTIRLNPADLSRISAATLESASNDPAAGRDVRWRADTLINEGSCVVEGPERMVDGRADKALLRIYQALVTDDQGLVSNE